MKIVRFDPWSYVHLVRRDLRRTTAADAATQWIPSVDIVEEKGRFVLYADVPGVNPDDIEVAMEAGVLTVSGVRPATERGEDSDVRRTERASGHFLRRFTLPESADPDKISAKSNNGVLEVAIPKLPEIQARRITVEAA